MSKKIVILNGSPRRKGNTSALVKAFTEGAESAGNTVTEFFLDSMNIHGCKGCFGGHSSRECPCVQKDDMEKIYPDVKSRSALTVFKIYEGAGEWFDLSKQLIERASFSFGGAREKETGYFVTDKCIGCKLCYSKCPQKCIDISVKPVRIRQEHCLHCGNCYEICPARAIERR